MRGEKAACGALAMDRVGIRGMDGRRKPVERDAGLAAPALGFALCAERDRNAARDDVASSRELEPQVMSVGAELDLQVAIAVSQQEELDDLEFPERGGGSRRRVGRRVGVKGGVDVNFQLVSVGIETDFDVRELARGERLSVPGAADLEACSFHLYNASIMADDTSPEPLPDGSPTDPPKLPDAVLRAYPVLTEPVSIERLSGGLLHQSFHLRSGDVEYVLQRVSDVFAPEIHDNILAVTTHLAARDVTTATLVPAADGAPFAELGSLGRWRLMPHLGGASFTTLESMAQARSAGALVGRFHAALGDFHAPLAPLGIDYRDTAGVLVALRGALESGRAHRLFSEMEPLGRRVLERFESLGPAPEVSSRVIHGDLKLENLLFESACPPGRDRAFALIDLDTLMRGPLWVELGDAWRSWCNPAGEDTRETRFDFALFEASACGFFEGYGEAVPEVELASLVDAPERLALELCARFATDAIEESYFGWDATRFPGRGEHNATRAAGQWNLSEQFRESRSERERVLLRER